jgi:GntR family transcriptional regulator
MEIRVNSSSGVPIYLQLMEQIKHAVDTGAVREGEQLPTIRKIAQELTMNPNTVARAYRELEREGVIEVRHGSGAYISATKTTSARSAGIRRAGELLRRAIEQGAALGLSEAELRRAFESELSQLPTNTAPARRRV